LNKCKSEKIILISFRERKKKKKSICFLISKNKKHICQQSFRERQRETRSTAFNLNNNIKQFNKDNQALVDKSTCIRKINLSMEFESILSKLILNHFNQSKEILEKINYISFNKVKEEKTFLPTPSHQ
jgi:predicted YcjX-like family ATPase